MCLKTRASNNDDGPSKISEDWAAAKNYLLILFPRLAMAGTQHYHDFGILISTHKIPPYIKTPYISQTTKSYPDQPYNITNILPTQNLPDLFLGNIVENIHGSGIEDSELCCLCA
jgi:hypothetical protein